MILNLNADLGESFGPWPMGDDANLLKIVDSANVACGFHAGDPTVIANTITTAREANVSIGAHPGFPDLQGFGRRPMSIPHAEIYNLVQYQLAALDGMSRCRNWPISHVKPHGALNNMACEDPDLAEVIVRAVKQYNPELIFLAPVLSCLAEAALAASLNVALEVFADRAYTETASLVPRQEPGAVLHEAAECIAHVRTMIDSGGIVTLQGNIIPTEFHSICVHGDNMHAVDTAHQIREALEQSGHMLKPLPDFMH